MSRWNPAPKMVPRIRHNLSYSAPDFPIGHFSLAFLDIFRRVWWPLHCESGRTSQYRNYRPVLLFLLSLRWLRCVECARRDRGKKRRLAIGPINARPRSFRAGLLCPFGSPDHTEGSMDFFSRSAEPQGAHRPAKPLKDKALCVELKPF